MSDTVVDSSVAAKWVLPEPDSTQAHRVISDVAVAGHRLIILDIAESEIANAIWKRLHRGLASLAEASQFLDELLRSPVTVEPSHRLLRSAFEIAAKYDRSIYDALFVALVQDLDLRGVTADEPLYNSVHSDFPRIVLLRDW
jgi:predicted nucleic acid-binding protein